MTEEYDFQKLAEQMRNMLMTPGEDEKAVEYVKNLFKKLSPIAKNAGLDVSKIDINKLDKQTLFKILNSDNINKYSGDTISLMKAVKPFLEI